MSFPFPLPLLLDGATGSNLIRAGMPAGVCVEEWILEHPEAILSLQKAFLRAGSQAILAPTFGANRAKLKNYGMEDRVEEWNLRLVALAKEAAEGSGVLIGGDLSPTGLMAEPYGQAAFTEILEVYREQVQSLKKAGVDFIMAETQMSLADARAAVLAAKEAGLPVFVSMTLEENGRTVMGADLLPVVLTLEAMGADAVGLNCSTGPAAMEEKIRQVLPYTSLPILCKPNAGKPCAEDPTKYDLSPDAFAEGVKKLLEAGARIVGGCCGTTPEHIAALSEDLRAGTFAFTAQREKSPLAMTTERSCFFLEEGAELTEPIPCTEDLGEDLMDVEEENAIALVRISSAEEVKTFLENTMIASVPLAVTSSDPETLEAVLRDFQGRLVVDARSPLDGDALRTLTGRYGAILFGE